MSIKRRRHHLRNLIEQIPAILSLIRNYGVIDNTIYIGRLIITRFVHVNKLQRAKISFREESFCVLILRVVGNLSRYIFLRQR